MGPTAAGKTALALELSQQLPVDIISVDSAMVYCGLDIGTGKPCQEELKLAPHKLIDICDPSDRYSVAQFCDDAHAAMESSWLDNRIPLLVGGTMLYFNVLQNGLSELPAANLAVRQELLEQAEKQGWPVLHAKLANLDAASAMRIHPNDPQRIQRALEICLTTGKSLTDLYQEKKESKIRDWQVKLFAIAPSSRTILHERIVQRFDNMLDNGFENEVELLYNREDLSPDLPAIRSVGYRQIWSYLNGEIDFATMRVRAVAATRQLAKRQFTWLQRWKDLVWIDTLAKCSKVKQIKNLF